MALSALPADVNGAPRLGFFPGSTIGNLEPQDATAFLRRARALLGDRGAMVLGVDLKKDPRRLHDAYNDSAGVTAAFTLNLLRRMNRELDATFDLAAFAHEAFYSEVEGRIEIYFRSLRAADRHRRRPVVHLRRGRAGAYGVFLQVRHRRHRGAGPQRRLHHRPDLDRSRPAVRRDVPGSSPLKCPLKQAARPRVSPGAGFVDRAGRVASLSGGQRRYRIPDHSPSTTASLWRLPHPAKKAPDRLTG